VTDEPHEYEQGRLMDSGAATTGKPGRPGAQRLAVDEIVARLREGFSLVEQNIFAAGLPTETRHYIWHWMDTRRPVESVYVKYVLIEQAASLEVSGDLTLDPASGKLMQSIIYTLKAGAK
jgi:hypothetical protein